jgi:hypothetical protein
VPWLRSIRWLLILNAAAFACVIAGADRSSGLLILGWALLLPGSLVAALIEVMLAPRGSLAFWDVADVLYLPSSVVFNILALWVTRRAYRRLVRSAKRDA